MMSPDPDPPKNGVRLRYRNEKGDQGGEVIGDEIPGATIAVAIMRVSQKAPENDAMPEWERGDIFVFARPESFVDKGIYWTNEDYNELMRQVDADNGAAWRKILADDSGTYEGFIRTAIIAELK